MSAQAAEKHGVKPLARIVGEDIHYDDIFSSFELIFMFSMWAEFK